MIFDFLNLRKNTWQFRSFPPQIPFVDNSCGSSFIILPKVSTQYIQRYENNGFCDMNCKGRRKKVVVCTYHKLWGLKPNHNFWLKNYRFFVFVSIRPGSLQNVQKHKKCCVFCPYISS